MWADVAERAGGAFYDDSFVVGKFASLPTDVPAMPNVIRRLWAEAETTAHPASGVIFAHIPAVRFDANVGAAQELSRELGRIGATGAWHAAPRGTTTEVLHFGSGALADEYQARIRRALDPRKVFDPTRGVPGSGS